VGDDADDKVQQGIEHLQAAAREMIKASRSLLDAAEELIEDPRSVQDLVGSLGTLAQAAAVRLRQNAGTSTDGDDDDGDGSEQRNKVS
jgi:hypothetical protein